jgi:hypothetical protein
MKGQADRPAGATSQMSRELSLRPQPDAHSRADQRISVRAYFIDEALTIPYRGTR